MRKKISTVVMGVFGLSTVLGAVLAAVARADSDDLVGSDIALVMGPSDIPTPSTAEVNAFDRLYLEPNGFTGQVEVLTTPETYDYGPSVAEGTQDLVNKVEAMWNAGDFSASDPLTIGGYSQSAVIAGDAEQTLYQYGIPTDAIHFVLVGDTAAATTTDTGASTGVGGFLETWAETPTGQALLNDIGWSNLIGHPTPDQFYQTLAYDIHGDYWADFVNEAWNGKDLHYDYMGLTPADIADATTVVDGMTTYVDIATPADWLTSLFDALATGI